MLTADLVRVTVRKGQLRPRYVDPAATALHERAEQLVGFYERHQGLTRAELDESLDDLVGVDTEFAITRGLAKLCDDRATWETVAPIDPVELRRRVFELAAARHPVGTRRSTLHPVSRADVLEDVARELGVAPREVEVALYADLKAEQRLTSWRALDATALLHRYNVALAQGMLLRAHELRLRVAVRAPKRVRLLFRALKFHQLMHRASRDGADWVITVDGPMCLFQQSQRYGVQLANLVPSLLHLEKWSLEADVDWHKTGQALAFRLDPSDGLVSHTRARGTWRSSEEKLLVERLAKHKSGWRAERRAVLVDLDGRGVVVPDLVLTHPPSGREALVDIVGFWRRGYLERRAGLLAEHGPPNLVLCVSRRLVAGEKAAITDDVPVVEFAEVISIPKLVAAAEAVALPAT